MEANQLPSIRKSYIVIGIVLLFVIGIMFFFLKRQQKNSPSTVKIMPPEVISPLLMEQNLSPATQQPPTGWIDRSTEDFVVSIPSEWTASREDIANGKSTMMTPTNGDDISVSLYIEPYNNIVQIEQRRQFYTNLGYVESPGTVNEVDVAVFRGEVPSPKDDGSNAFSVLQDTVYIVAIMDKLYLIKAHYVSDTVDQQKEEMLKKIVSTIQFQ